MLKVALILLLTSYCFAIEGIVTVLEAPLFHTPDDNAPVIMWVRKGDKLHIHGSSSGMNINPELEQEANLEGDPYVHYQSNLNDPLFKARPYTHSPNDEFYQTIDLRGMTSYIKKEHVFLLSQRPEEIAQDLPESDNTDYRLNEPLHKNYPFDLKRPEKVTMLALGSGTESRSSQVYLSNIEQEKTILNFNFEGFIGNTKKDFKEDRGYYGFGFLINNLNNRIETSEFLAQENWTRLGIGPLYTFCPWYQEDFELHLSLGLYLQYTSLSISIEEDLGENDIYSNRYQGFHLIPRTGMFVQFNELFGKLDLITGFYGQLEIQKVYAPDEEGWTRSFFYTDADKGFEQATSIEFNAFLGLQRRM